jgi:hypothetical protein
VEATDAAGPQTVKFTLYFKQVRGFLAPFDSGPHFPKLARQHLALHLSASCQSKNHCIAAGVFFAAASRP